MNEKYYLLLRYIPKLGNIRIKKLFDLGYSAKGIWDEFKSEVENLSKVDHQVDEELAKVATDNIHIITYHHNSYPRLLKEIADPPSVLFVKGELVQKDDSALAVVGTRKVSGYGREAIEMIVPHLCSCGLTIVSGMARGADSLVHQATLSSGGRTIAVLGSGLDIIYPPENKELFLKIIDNGAVVSELPLGYEPTNFTFPMRNRLIAGMSLGVLVVEAPEKSGALITADLALSQNREVFALPGSVFAPNSRGTNRLIKQGSVVVTNAEDIIKALNLQVREARGKTGDYLLETEIEKKICELLDVGPKTIDQMVREAQLSAAEVGATLSILEVKGVVREVINGQYRKI